jgi:hypothetical protein
MTVLAAGGQFIATNDLHIFMSMGQAMAQAEHLFRPAERFYWGGGEALIWKSRVLD